MVSVLRRSYTIRRWLSWDHEIHAFAVDFERAFGLFPNILLAASPTLAHVDMAAKRERLIGPAGERPTEHEYASVGSFAGDGYALAFCVDESVPAKAVSLVFDADPDGGEPLPEEDTPLGDTRARVGKTT